MADVPNGGVANPTFSMLLSAASAPTVTLGRPFASIYREPTSALIEWFPIVWGNQPGVYPSNVVYTVYIWPLPNPSPAFNLAVPCGIDAFQASLPQNQLAVTYQVPVGVTQGSVITKTINMLDPATTYTVAIKATCAPGASGGCMMANYPGQTIAYLPSTTDRAVTATVTPAPAPAPAAKKSVAGPVIGVLIALAVVGAGGFFAYRRWRAGGFASSGGNYARFAVQSSSSSAAQAATDDGTLYSKR